MEGILTNWNVNRSEVQCWMYVLRFNKIMGSSDRVDRFKSLPDCLKIKYF